MKMCFQEARLWSKERLSIIKPKENALEGIDSDDEQFFLFINV